MLSQRGVSRTLQAHRHWIGQGAATSTAASWKDIRLFTPLDSLVPMSCLANVARKEATSTQFCNNSHAPHGTRYAAM